MSGMSYLPKSHRYFVDRSIGSDIVPHILRNNGLDIITMSEHFGEEDSQYLRDEEWLKVVGENGWVAFTKDRNIFRKQAERAVLESYEVKCFCVTGKDMSGRECANKILKNLKRIEEACYEPGPFFYTVQSTKIEKID